MPPAHLPCLRPDPTAGSPSPLRPCPASGVQPAARSQPCQIRFSRRQAVRARHPACRENPGHGPPSEGALDPLPDGLVFATRAKLVATPGGRRGTGTGSRRPGVRRDSGSIPFSRRSGVGRTLGRGAKTRPRQACEQAGARCRRTGHRGGCSGMLPRAGTGVRTGGRAGCCGTLLQDGTSGRMLQDRVGGLGWRLVPRVGPP